MAPADDGACIIGTSLAACFLDPYKKRWRLTARQPCWERRKRELLDNTNRICLRVKANHEWVSEKKAWRYKNADFYSFSSMTSKCPVCGSGACCGFSAPTERINILRSHTNFREKSHEVTDAALQDAIHSPLGKGWTPRDVSWKPYKIIGAL